MGEEDPEFVAEQAFADVVVAVAVGPERGLRIVHVQRSQLVEADLLVDLGEHPVELFALRDVVTGRVEMARVEADPEPLVGVQGVVEGCEFFD